MSLPKRGVKNGPPAHPFSKNGRGGGVKHKGTSDACQEGRNSADVSELKGRLIRAKNGVGKGGEGWSGKA